jgi:L-fuculose-phosphate aldolase
MTENQLRAELIETAKASIERGINHGSAGNVSVRWHRGGSDGLLITPSALPCDQYTPDDIVWMSIVPVPGAQPTPPAQPVIDGLRRPSSEWRFHHDLYARRPEVNAVVHTHAPHCAALSCLPRVQQGGIPAFHYMVAAAGGADIRCAPYAAFGTQALSDLALTALEDRRACLLAHHGMIAVGQTLPAALALAVEVEWLARTYAQTLQLGTPDILSAQQMDEVLRKFADYRS